MASLFGNLDIGRKALQAQQQALQVTSNNIANVNTPGYSRQRAILETSPPIQTGAGEIGTGVDVKNIESVRDRFVEVRVSQGTQESAKQQTIFDSLDQVQAVFNTGDKGLQEGISRFFNSFSTLANNPESTALRNNVVSAAQNLASLLQSTSRSLVNIQQNINLAVVDSVNQINSIMSEIASLNLNIVSSEAGGNEASTLRDQRSELISKLSELVDIRYYEADDGTVNINVAGSQALVTGGLANRLTAVPTAPSGLVRVKSGLNDITASISGGKLAGLIQVRDQRIPAYQNDLDTLAAGIISQVNTQHSTGTDLQVPPTNPGLNFFNPVAGIPGAAQAISLNPAIAADVKNIAAGQSGSPGDNANALAIANLADQKLLTGGTETFAQAFSSIQFKIGTDTQSAQRSLNTQGTLLTQLKNQRDSISGVSLDDEAIDLVRFQRAYQASAKFISVIDQLTEALINTLS